MRTTRLARIGARSARTWITVPEALPRLIRACVTSGRAAKSRSWWPAVHGALRRNSAVRELV